MYLRTLATTVWFFFPFNPTRMFIRKVATMNPTRMFMYVRTSAPMANGPFSFLPLCVSTTKLGSLSLLECHFGQHVNNFFPFSLPQCTFSRFDCGRQHRQINGIDKNARKTKDHIVKIEKKDQTNKEFYSTSPPPRLRVFGKR
jgi:hypothetical protein